MRALAAACLLASAAAAQDFSQQAYLKASNAGAGDEFGYSLAISGDTVVVGAWTEDGSDDTAIRSGAVYVFVRDGASWSQQAYLKASNAGLDDRFGESVAIAGDTIVVGATGESSSATGVGGDGRDDSALNAGAAYVFVRDGTTWSQQAYLKASNTDAHDQFGEAVAVSGDTVAVGAFFEDSSATGVDGDQADNSAPFAGAVYVFTRDGTTWTQQAYLKASNTEEFDSFGRKLALCDDTLVVGVRGENSNATGVNGDQGDNSLVLAGAAYVFVRDGATWSQQAYLKASNTEERDMFGSSVSVSGDTIVVGARDEDSSAMGVDGDQADNGAGDSGAAYVFVRDGTSWSQQAYLKASNTEAADRFGNSLGVSGDTIVVGAEGEDSLGHQGNNDAFGAGAAYVFARNGTSWSQQDYLKASNAEAVPGGLPDQFAWSLGVSGNTIAVGALREDSGATEVDGDQDDNSAPDAGAAYVFHAPLPECFLVIGDGPGDATFFDVEHLFETQVGPTVEDSYAVLMDDIPEFVLPGAMKQRGVSSAGGASPAWMLDGQFAVQVLMWNPQVFPELPEQYTAGLHVTVHADGSVSTTPYGTNLGGLTITHELDVNANGQPVIRFPFVIPGM